jgi:3-deoxy-manno-octulosonate cytidylyltransferase (CMP-KDO synthetase)
MSTLKARASAEDYANPNVVKVVTDQRGDALYFSSAATPLSARHRPRVQTHRPLRLPARLSHHLRRAAADAAELAESLEQLRALEHGYRIRTVETQHPTIEAWTLPRT